MWSSLTFMLWSSSHVLCLIFWLQIQLLAQLIANTDNICFWLNFWCKVCQCTSLLNLYLTHNVKLVLCQTKYSLNFVPSYLILEETLLPAATASWRSSLVLRNIYARRYTQCTKRYHQHRRYAFSINNTFVWIMTSELLDVYTDTFHSAGWTEMYHFTLPNSKHSSICNYMFSVTLIL